MTLFEQVAPVILLGGLFLLLIWSIIAWIYTEIRERRIKMSNCSKCEYLGSMLMGHPRSPRREIKYSCLANPGRRILQPELGECEKFIAKISTEDGCTVRLDNE